MEVHYATPDTTDRLSTSAALLSLSDTPPSSLDTASIPRSSTSTPTAMGNITPAVQLPDQSDGELAELLWSKSAVFLQPSLSARDGHRGFLSIVRAREKTEDAMQEGEEVRWRYLLSWVPETLVEGTRDYEAYVLVELSSRTSLSFLSLQQTSHVFLQKTKATSSSIWHLQPIPTLPPHLPDLMLSPTLSPPSTPSKSNHLLSPPGSVASPYTSSAASPFLLSTSTTTKVNRPSSTKIVAPARSASAEPTRSVKAVLSLRAGAAKRCSANFVSTPWS